MIPVLVLLLIAPAAAFFELECGGVQGAPTKVKEAKVKFAAGQVWTYTTRPQDKDSTLTIFKVEDYHGKPIVHIRIDGLNIKNPGSSSGFSRGVGHVPISEEALAGSTVKLVRTGASVPPESMQGYQNWRTAADAGKAGIFTIPVAKIADFSEETICKGQKSPN